MSYPERLGYMLLNELDSSFKDFLNSQNASEFKKNGEALLRKYNDPKFDKLAEARRNVNDVKVQMSDNMNKLLENHNDLEDLEEGAIDMKKNAEKFKKGSHQLEREMWWKKVKLIVCIVLIVIAVIVAIVLMAKYL
jgi:vesicle-associated membrane protein 4